MLAVAYGLEKIYTYIYCCPIIVFSDHKPLESLQLMQLSLTPPRLQHMLLHIQPYDISIRYRLGKYTIYADYLFCIAPTVGPSIELEHAIHMVQISVQKLLKPQDETRKDAELSALREQVINGWPNDMKCTPKLIRSYWSMHGYISVENSILYAGN